MKLLRRGQAFVKQWGINRDVARGQKLWDQLISEGYTPEQIRVFWLETSGMKHEDWPHSHDEGP